MPKNITKKYDTTCSPLSLLLASLLALFLSLLLPSLSPINLIAKNNTPSKEKYQIYLITIDKGSELYTQWGHNAIRVKNTENNQDLLYNYGTFSFSPSFVKDFAKGNLIYWLSVTNYNNSIKTYTKNNRSTFSQKLNLTNTQTHKLVRLLKENAKPQNKQYKYSHLNNNCSTKIRDIINTVLNKQIQIQSSNKISNLSARHYMIFPIQNNPALTFLFDFLLNSSVDKNLNFYEEMFIPSKLKQHITNIYNTNDKGKKIKLVSNQKTIFTAKIKPTPPLYKNIGFVITVFLLTTILWGIVYPLFTLDNKKKQHNFKIAFALFTIGLISTLLSLLLIYTNLFSEHKSFYNNESHFAIFITDFFLVIAAFTLKNNKNFTTKILKLWSYSKLIIIVFYFILYFFGVFNQDKIYIFVIISIIAFLIALLSQILSLTYNKKNNTDTYNKNIKKT